MHCDICCSFPLYEILKQHLSTSPILTIMAGHVNSADARFHGRFIFNDKTLGKALTFEHKISSVCFWVEVQHYTESPESDLMMIRSLPYPQVSSATTVNCGVYLYTVELLYAEPCFGEYAEKYRRILEMSKDDHHERSLSKL